MKPDFISIAKTIAIKSSTEFVDKYLVHSIMEALESVYKEGIEDGFAKGYVEAICTSNIEKSKEEIK